MKYILTVLCSFICMNFFAQWPVVTSISGPSVACTGLTVTYTVTATNSPSSYPGFINPSPGSINGNGDSLIFINFVYPGTYTLYCAGSNTAGIGPYTQKIINVFETPTVNFSGSNTFCQGSSTNLMASSTVMQGSPTVSYSWAPPTGLNTTTGQQVIANPSTATNYTVTAANGACSRSNTITVTPFEQLPVTFSGANTFCQGSSTNLSASATIFQASSTISYNWSPAYGLNTTTGPNVTANPGNTTTYTVTVFYGSCSNSAQITVIPNGFIPPTLTVTATNTLMCYGDTTRLTAYGANTYTWTNNVHNDVVFVPAYSNTYYVTGTDVNGCTGTSSVNVYVNPAPYFYAVTNNNYMFPGTTATITLTNGPAGSTYSLNGTPTPTMIVVTPTVTTDYVFSTVNANGCTYTTTLTLFVGSFLSVETINTTATEKYFKVFPNPSNGVFNIRSGSKETVKIINELGEVIRVLELEADTDQQISGLSSGIYVVTTDKMKMKIIVTQ